MQGKKFILPFLVVLFLFCLNASAECELRGYDDQQKSNKYVYVTYGNYPYEKDGTAQPVLWRVLTTEDGRALLLTENVVDVQQVIFETDENAITQRLFRKISDYIQSDLYVWMNDTMLHTMFEQDEIDTLYTIDRGQLFCLTTEEYLKPEWGFTKSVYSIQRSRWAYATPYAVKQGCYVDKTDGIGGSPYWVASIKNETDIKLQLVGYNGHLSYGVYTRTNVGLRVAVWLEMNECKIVAGNGTKNSPYEVLPTIRKVTSIPSLTPTFEATPEPAFAPAPVLPTVVSTVGFTSTPIPTATPEPIHVTIDIVGDLDIEGLTGDDVTQRLSEVSTYLQNDDLTVGNLLGFAENSDGSNALLSCGVDAVSTMNHYALNMDFEKYMIEQESISSLGLIPFGTNGIGTYHYTDVCGIYEAKNVKFGLIAFSTFRKDTEALWVENRVKSLREQGCDVIIVSLDWNETEQKAVSTNKIAMAKKMLTAGADIVFCHHADTLLPVQFYNGKPILNDVGLFLSDEGDGRANGIFRFEYDVQSTGATMCSFEFIACTLSAEGTRVTADQNACHAARSLLQTKREINKITNLPNAFTENGIYRP